VFLLLQRNAQVGANTSEHELMALDRGAVRMTGDGMITLYRTAPTVTVASFSGFRRWLRPFIGGRGQGDAPDLIQHEARCQTNP